MRAKLKEIKQEMRRRMHQPIPEQGKWLGRSSAATSTITQCRPTSGRSMAFRHHVTDSGGARFGVAARRIGSTWDTDDAAGGRLAPETDASFIPGRAIALPSHTRGGSRMRESRTYGSVRGALSNARPYRDRQRKAGAIQPVEVRPK